MPALDYPRSMNFSQAAVAFHASNRENTTFRGTPSGDSPPFPASAAAPAGLRRPRPGRIPQKNEFSSSRRPHVYTRKDVPGPFRRRPARRRSSPCGRPRLLHHFIMRIRPLLILLLSAASASAHAEGTTTIFLGTNRVTLEVAETAIEQRTGLMHRASLEENRGMLFVFSEPRSVAMFHLRTRSLTSTPRLSTPAAGFSTSRP